MTSIKMVKNFKIIKNEGKTKLTEWDSHCYRCGKPMQKGYNYVNDKSHIYHLSCYKKHAETTVEREKTALSNAKKKLNTLSRYANEMICESLEEN